MNEKMTCRELVAALSEYLDLELPAVDVERIEKHAESCGSCNSFKETLRTTVTLLKSNRATMTPDLHARIMDNLEQCLRQTGESH